VGYFFILTAFEFVAKIINMTTQSNAIASLRNDSTGELAPPHLLGTDATGAPLYLAVEGWTPITSTGAAAICTADEDGNLTPVSESDLRAIRSLAQQDQAGETDDSYARTGDSVDTIKRWCASARQAGDSKLVEIVDRMGVDVAAEVYEAVRAVRS